MISNVLARTGIFWLGYFPETIATISPDELVEAEAEIANACAVAGVATVVGTPHYTNGRCFNSATVIDSSGRVVGRQHKLQLVPTDDWAVAGEDMHVRALDMSAHTHTHTHTHTRARARARAHPDNAPRFL